MQRKAAHAHVRREDVCQRICLPALYDYCESCLANALPALVSILRTCSNASASVTSCSADSTWFPDDMNYPQAGGTQPPRHHLLQLPAPSGPEHVPPTWGAGFASLEQALPLALFFFKHRQ